MRVVLVIGQLEVGGTEGQLLLLARGLRDRGVQVYVVPLFRLGRYAEELRKSGVTIWQPGFPTAAESRFRPWKVAAAAARLTMWLRRVRPDVVHAFLYHAMVVSVPCARAARVPIIVGGRRCLSSFVGNRPGRLLVERVVARICDMVVANSDAVAADVVACHNLPSSKVVVIKNALPPQAFESVPAAYLCSANPIVLTVANLHLYKGHTYLLDAAAALSAEGRAVTLVFAGSGPEEASLRLKAARNNVDLRLLGLRADVRELLAACDMFVLPSLTEGASNAVMESMAAGCPTITTDVGGNGDLVGDAGVVVPREDPDALRGAMKAVLMDGERAEWLRSRARERAHWQFSHDVLVDAHIELYQSLRIGLCAESPAT